ncbi:hypothetical protein NCC78_06710 [Micromonospora phytophila]|uniref:hypothetical protein n=1 Tax=Micromonospora phytophila TaxID=709888 RepID=UPI002030D699|nr:hypothetical protein [Micromonospora phytophila]MCM0674380.1 hypothetical protein [Micromonospora phytophila]
MSKKFLTKLAGGVVLGSAALLLSAPAAALAASDGEYGDSNGKDRNGFVCATNEQINELIVANIISDNDIEDSEVDFEQSVEVDQTNDSRTQPNNIIVCIRDIDVDVDVED